MERACLKPARHVRVSSHRVVLAYLNLPNPTFLSVPIINPNMEFIGTRQKSRFWWVEVGLELRIRAECSGFGAPWDLIKHTV